MRHPSRSLLVLLIAAVWPAAALAQTTPAPAQPPEAPLPAPAAATAASPIVWRLKNPFRHFSKPEHWAFYADVARGALTGTQQPVLATERALADKTDGHGWAAAVFEHVVDEACWYEPEAAGPGTPPNKAPGEPCGAYVKPTGHRIVLQAPGIDTACTWTIGATVLEKPDCRQPVEATIPYPQGAEVSLAAQGSTIATATIRIEDLLVIGLGDSFGAGDGNPDRPVSFRVNRPMSYDDERNGYPQRYPLDEGIRYTDARFQNRAAGWVNRNCHRSLYSHQLRTALHLALDDPGQQRSVTYLGLACSGATMLNMFDLYKGYDEPAASTDPAHARRQSRQSQLDVLAHALCEPGSAKPDPDINYNEGEALELGQRPIRVATCAEDKRLRKPDLVLLSVGGNDVGFSGLVSNASLRGQFLGVVKLFSEDPRITPAKAAAFMGRLPARYAALAKALKAVTGLDTPSRILLSAYPHMHENAQGQVCGSGRSGFDVSAAWNLQGKAVAAAEQFMDATFTPGMVKAAGAAGWTFVDQHRSAGYFRKRGLCAVSADETPELANTLFPRCREAGSEPGWAPFKPDAYRHYASRQRFFLTPNDAFLGAHFHTRHIPILDGGPDVQLALWSAYSGAFHPTAEGQAAIADAVLATARTMVAKPPVAPAQ